MPSVRTRAPLLCAAVLALALVALPRDGHAQQRPAAAQPTVLDRARATWNDAVNAAKGLGKSILDHGHAAIDWAKKKWASSHVLASLFGYVKGSPVIKWLSKTGQEIVKRLEHNPRAMVGQPAVSQALPPYLQKLADWRKKRGVK